MNHEVSDNLDLRAGISHQDHERDRYDNQFRGLPDADGNIDIRARRRINRWDYTTYYADLIGECETGPVSHLVLVGVDKTDVEIDNNETAENLIFTTNVFDPEILPDPQLVTAEENVLRSEDRSGVTIQDVISLGEQWRFLVGGRYDEYEASFGPKAENFTPRVGIVYLPVPSLSLYGSYSESFEPNGEVGSGFANAGEALDPTTGEQIEAGVKWEALGGNLLTTGAIFNIERTGAPIEDILANRIVQRGTSEHQGAELTITGPLSENITLHGSATYLDAEITEDDDPSLVGNTPYGVAEWSLSLTGEYKILEGALDGLSLQGGVYYESDRPVDDANTYDLEAYTRLDAGLKYLWERPGSDVVFRLTAQNLTDEEYFKAPSPFAVNPERPREIRASIELQF